MRRPTEPRPRTITTRFPAERVQIGAVRQWAKESLPRLGLHLDDPLVADLQLTLSELGANAIVHGCGGDRADVRLTAALTHTPGVLRMSVTDSGRGRPEHRRADEVVTSGRGLCLVEAVTDRFGVDDLRAGGKTVWAEIDVPRAVSSLAQTSIVVADEMVDLDRAALRADATARAS
ncbi:ATP-binding protein [Kitasatospora cathayae]|uniref:ATP-binding protein n=1 Tax=Kitasatospora cathayae TaxID=3004092 RepID=A0ABY7PW05_9ACTN|nr:ATP-binding protein [Kitasatospora sp. HUAS 3-15]WBP84598.1 ATP-binding protein [Kitasatospora sp. HUAS 3-15]